MKGLVVFCFALLVGSAWSFKITSNLIMSECKRLEGAESSEIMDSHFGEDETPSQEAKCFYKCILERYLVLHDGNISPIFRVGIEGSLKEHRNNPEKIATLRSFKKCLNTTGVDSCDLAYNFIKCVEPEIIRNMLL